MDTRNATRYLVPLREGGSLPAVVESEDETLWVVKFKGAGQGAKALIAEAIVAGLARVLQLPVPSVSLIHLDEDFGRTEPDPEIQDILRGSRGLNFGMRYLEGALNYNSGAADDLVDSDFASRLVWLDAFTTNPDRSHKNPNLLVHEEALWLIDHGAALYAHHDWSRVDRERARAPFALIEQHVLLARASELGGRSGDFASALTEEHLRRVLAGVPSEWFMDPVGGGEFESPEAARSHYLDYLQTRLAEPRDWVVDLENRRRYVTDNPPERLHSRR